MADLGDVSDWVTAFAALVALLIPFRMDKQQRQRAKDAQRDAIHEIVRAAAESLDNFLDARTAVKDLRHGQDAEAVRAFYEKADRDRMVLSTLIAGRDLTDGAVRLGVDASELARITAEACRKAMSGDVQRIEGAGMLERLATRAERVQQAITRMRTYHQLATKMLPPALESPTDC